MTERHAERGFTLVEILVAFAIVSITVLVVFRSFQSGLEHETQARAAQARTLEARSILAGIGVAGPLIETAETGRLESTGEVWRAEIIPLAAPAEAPLLPWRITLIIERDAVPILTLSTVKLARR